MMLGRGVFVPPTCPVTQKGMFPDLREAPFTFHAGSCTSDENYQATEMETFAAFGDDNDKYPNLVVSDSLVVPIDSDLAIKICHIAGANRQEPEIRDPSFSPRIEKIRVALCNRVAQCHGVINGECWALGEVGLRKVIEEI